MPRQTNSQSLSSIIEQAARPLLARLTRDISKAIDAARADAVSAPRHRQRAGKARSRRPRGEMTKWVADRNARRVPTFVIEATGLDTKKAIVAQYGEDARFEKGRPLPKEKSGSQSVRAAQKEAARTAKAKPPIIRKAAAAKE